MRLEDRSRSPTVFPVLRSCGDHGEHVVQFIILRLPFCDVTLEDTRDPLEKYADVVLEMLVVYGKQTGRVGSFVIKGTNPVT